MPPKTVALCPPPSGTRDLVGTIQGARRAAGTCGVSCSAPASFTLRVLLAETLFAESLLRVGFFPESVNSETGP